MSTPIARRYASALYEFLGEEKVSEGRGVLLSLSNAINKSDDLKAFIGNPLLGPEAKGKIFARVFAGHLPESIDRFIQFVNSKNRLSFLPSMLEAFEELYLEKHNEIKAVVETAEGLNEEDQRNVIAKLNDMCHKNVLTDFRLNSALLGGFRLWAQGRLYDASIQTQLTDFQQKVSA